MRNDPIIAEIRKIRQELAREAGFSLELIFQQEAEEFARKWAGQFKMATERDLAPSDKIPLPEAK